MAILKSRKRIPVHAWTVCLRSSDDNFFPSKKKLSKEGDILLHSHLVGDSTPSQQGLIRTVNVITLRKKLGVDRTFPPIMNCQLAYLVHLSACHKIRPIPYQISLYSCIIAVCRCIPTCRCTPAYSAFHQASDKDSMIRYDAFIGI